MLRDLSVIDRVASSRRDSRNAEADKRRPYARNHRASSRRDSRNAEADQNVYNAARLAASSSRRDSRNAEAAGRSDRPRPVPC